MFSTMRILLILSLFLVACQTTIEPSAASRDIEVLRQSDLGGEKARHCTEVGTFEVVSTSKEISSNRQSVLVVKARNQAVRHDATHVLVWPSSTFPCDEKAAEIEDGKLTCERAPANAYRCVVGKRAF